MSLDLLFVRSMIFPVTLLEFRQTREFSGLLPMEKWVVFVVNTASLVRQTAANCFTLFSSPAGAGLSLAEPGEWQTDVLPFSKWMMTLFFSKLTATCCPFSSLFTDGLCRFFVLSPSPPRQGGHCYCNSSRHLSLILSDLEGLPRGLMSVALRLILLPPHRR